MVKALLILSSSALFLLISIILLSRYAERKIHERITAQHAEVSSVQINLLTRSVHIKDFSWSSSTDSDSISADSIPPHFLKFNTLTLRGIKIIKLLKRNTIHLSEIVLDTGHVQYNISKEHSIAKAITSAYSLFKCDAVSLNHIKAEIKTDTIVSFSTLFSVHGTGAAVEIDSLKKSHYSIKQMGGVARRMNFSRHEGMYGGSIKRFWFNSEQRKIIIDSVLLIPNYTKYKFAQFLGEQAGRVNISIPRLTLEGVAFDQLIDSTFAASTLVIESFDLFSFKDKRIPFLNKEVIPLPMESFIKLPWKVKIDTLQIKDSRITIEEFPAKGDEVTTIVFNSVYATLTGLNNRSEETYAQLNAQGLLMGNGSVEAIFQLPLDGTSPYTARGKILKFELKELNPVFIPIANIRIESGLLNTLTFDFSYNEFNSNGKLDIDYENLRLLGLNKNNAATNEFKTFFINLFVRKNRDQTGTSAKAVGIIDMDRNRQRLIFNMWWISILDGLKSSMLHHGKPKKEK